MTIIQKIDSLGSVVSGRKKMILKCATAGCVPLTIKENGITIKYINLSDQYIVVGSKIHTIKFTKFAANLPEGVKMLSAYESDKTLE